MKFEQALKAMRRGERVRRKHWKLTCPKAVIWIGADGAIKDNFNGGEKPGFTRDSHIVADDWVIVRKKKAAAPTPPPPPPRNIFTDPRVGDEFGDAHSTWRVIGVSYYQVAYKCVKICGHPGEHLYLVRRDYFAEYGSACATIARAPEEEVGSPDAK